MKYLMILLATLTTLNTQAQPQKKLEAFAKEYFKHFQKKDFDWIMNHYATPYEIEQYSIKKTLGYKSDHKWETNLRNSMAKSYKKSLQDQYDKNSFVKNAKITNIKIDNYSTFPKSTRVTITFKTAKGKLYTLTPAHWFLTARNKWVYYGKYIRIYEKRKAIKKSASTILARGDADMDIAAPPEPRKKYKSTSDNKAYDFVEQMPEFPGGENAMMNWLANNIEYPIEASELGITGIVYINFTIYEDGSIHETKILREIGGGCGKAALRAVKKMPKWKPGKSNGKAVRTHFTLPVEFSSPE